MNSGRCLQIAAVLGFLAVTFGSFGAHGLKGNISPAALETFEIGVRYQMYHALALFGVGLLMKGLDPIPKGLKNSALAFLIGIALFSGSLYLLAITGFKALGAVAPIGGVAFLVGWFLLAISVKKAASA